MKTGITGFLTLDAENDMISKTQQDNRFILKNGMEKYGFKGITTEWWHFTLKNEPFPDKYFDFTVK